MRIGLLSMVAVAALIGCGSDSKERTAPLLVPPPGFVVVADSNAGFSIALPEDWVIMPLYNLKLYGETAERLKNQDPALTEPLERGRLFVGRGQLFALDPADKGASTVGVIASESGADEKLEVVAKQAGEALTRGGATGFTTEGATVAGVPAIKATFNQPLPTDTGTKDVPYTQYYILRDGLSYVLTLTGSAPEIPAIVESLRIA